MATAITALVLAGGRGSRMGGVDKGLQPFQGQAMAQHVIERLRPQVDALLVSANRNLDAYQAFGYPVLADALPDFAGPLAGLQVGLQACQTPLLLTAPCDSPVLPPDLALRLLAGLQDQQADLAVVSIQEDGETRGQPVFCLMKTSLAPHLQRYLDSGGRKMRGWWQGLKVAEVLFEDSTAFRNINSHDAMPAAPLSVDTARQRILSALAPVAQVETLSLHQALGRTLAFDLVSPIDVPAHDNSAMDGYALRSADLPASGQASLRVIGAAYAGTPFHGQAQAGQCVRIMTGAVMPAGCDTVIPFELVAASSEDAMRLDAGVVKAGANRRFRGEDLQAGAPALHAGRVLHPADLGLAASLGLNHLTVRRRLRVAVFSTGDELRDFGEALGESGIYDSNRYTVCGMLARLGCEVIDLGIVRDDPQALEAALRQASEQADAIITSGGVSSGDADYTREVLGRLGQVEFWKMEMRPGRPLAFGRIGDAMLFGLPGNPVASMVAFYFFAREALLKMMGATQPLPLLRVTAAERMRKRPGRTEYQRGILEGQQVRLTGAQGSGILRSMTEANCIIVLGHDQGEVAAGDPVEVILFDGLT